MRVLRAAWTLPITRPPIHDGWVAIEDGRIVDLGGGGTPSRIAYVADETRDLGRVALLPGLVNAHTHIELSYLRGEIPPAADFLGWVRPVIAARAARDSRSAAVAQAIDGAIDEAIACGTALVGDISNTLVTCAPLVASPLAGVVFYELIRFGDGDADALVSDAGQELERQAQNDRVRTSLAAHAPYSVSPDVFRAIQRAVSQSAVPVCSVHLAESAEEVQFIQEGRGPWRSLLNDIGAWNPAWTPPGVTPVEYLDGLGFFNNHVLAVHGVHATDRDLARLAERGATLVTCPRSNMYTGVGLPPLERFYASGVGVAVGTDSLASAPDLNLFEELKTMRALAPSVPAGLLLDSATRRGAEALGMGQDYGTIAPGRRARLIAVEVPSSATDVEEYLLSGISQSQVSWIE